MGASTIPKPAQAADTAQMLASELSKVWNEAKGVEGAAEPVRAERPSLAPRPDLLAEEQGIAAPASGGNGSGTRKIDAPEAEAIDLLDAAGGTMAKRLVPLLGGLVVLLVLITLLRRRRRRA